ncbi:hypothetical protein [Chitinophaga tropicalis]|uniref:Uncharacterized protein n=1 Tax=Chitinophaga tropicalis TaxID=2683588 RepID=A0A7K1U058_9BACT|nr:hypothetical protein [Chitinophaga tropicalis]MVT07686.1 hypothetical protein [Chitinophaga tropicalis]
MIDTWKYKVIAQGRDYSIQMERFGTLGPLIVTDEFYFNHMEEALLAVLTRKPGMIDLEGNGSGSYYLDKINIQDNRNGQPLAQLKAITMDKSPEGDPVPGIYLAFTTELETACQQLQLNPDLFAGHYGPNGVLLARYSYTQRDGVVLSHADDIEELVERIAKKRSVPWQYCLSARDMLYAGTQANQPYQTICRHYHYPDYHTAFTGLLLTNPVDLDAYLRMHLMDKDSYTASVALTTRQAEPLAHLSLIKSDGYPGERHVGMYITFTAPPDAIKNLDNMPALYGHSHKLWTYALYRYNNNGESFAPVTNFFRLLTRCIVPNNAVPKEKGSYSLEFGYKDIDLSPGKDPSAQLILHSADLHYKNLDDAVQALFSIHNQLFSPVHQQAYSFFIPAATIKHTDDGQAVMTKSMTLDNPNHLKNGTDLQLMRDQLTPEVLSSIQKCFQQPGSRALPGTIQLPPVAPDERDRPQQREQGEHLHSQKRRNGL